MKNAHLFLAANLLVSTALLPAAESPQRVNLALNKPYAALPAPNDRATMRMADDGAILASDQATKTQQVGRAVLTDGVLSELNAIVYGDPRAVRWLRKGIVQIRIDLGEIHSIGEVALRLQGGMAPRPNVFPDQIEVLVSDDGKTFHRVDDFHFWRVGDRKHFELPQEIILVTSEPGILQDPLFHKAIPILELPNQKRQPVHSHWGLGKIV